MRYPWVRRPARGEKSAGPPSPAETAAMGAQIEGFALIRAPSKAGAVRRRKRFLEVAGDGESGISQVYERPDRMPAS